MSDDALPPGFTLDEAALPQGFSLDPPQMEGLSRSVAFPASNVLKGVVTAFGLPGDAVRGLGYLTGKAGEAAMNPDPMTTAMAPGQSWTPGSATAALPIVTPQMLAQAPGKTGVTAPSFHNPLDSESLLAGPRAVGLVDRPDLQPQGPYEKLEAAGAQGVGAALPMALTGGVPTLAEVLTTAARGAGGGLGGDVGGTVGDAVAGPRGRVVGTVLGSVLGGAPSATTGAVLPRTMSDETAALAQNAANRGINVSVGMASENPFVRVADSQLRRVPFSGYGAFDDANQRAFNRNVSQTFGEDAEKITPDVLNRAYNRIGNVYDDVATHTTIPVTGNNRLISDLNDVVDHARLNLSADSVDPVRNQVQNILDTAANNGGVLSGRQFKDLTAKNGPITTMQNSSDSGLRQMGNELRNVLNTHLSIHAAPEYLAALRQADTQYKALKTVEPLTMGASSATGGPAPATGDINPVTLNSRVNVQYDNAARAPLGTLPLKDLGQIGQRFLKAPANSETATRASVQSMLGHGGELAGATGAALVGDHLGVPLYYSIPSLAASLMGGRIAGAGLRTPAVRPPLTPMGAALLGGSPQITDPNTPPLFDPPAWPALARTAN